MENKIKIIFIKNKYFIHLSLNLLYIKLILFKLKFALAAQLDRAPDFGSGGSGFDS